MNAVFQFATVELTPYPDLGEFVIVGVVAVTTDRAFGFRMLPTAKTTRMTRFFPEIPRCRFTATLKELRNELLFLNEQINQGNEPNLSGELKLNDQSGDAIFRVLTSPREGMVRIVHRGTAKAESFEKWLDGAYQRFVLRERPEISDPVEHHFTSEIKDVLKMWRVARLYRETSVGSDDYHATFPFAFTPEGADLPERAIKPLHLGQNTPTQILDHGDTWLQKVRRLAQFNFRPQSVIFPVRLPIAESPRFEERNEAALYLIEDFKREGILVYPGVEDTGFRQSVVIEAAMPADGLFS